MADKGNNPPPEEQGAESDREATKFALTQICEASRAIFQAQITFFSFFVALNGVAGGWLVEHKDGSQVYDDDQFLFALFFIGANLVCTIAFMIRARELISHRDSFDTLLESYSGFSSQQQHLRKSFPFAVYERTSLAFAIGSLFLFGAWTFALVESCGVGVPYSWIIGIAASVITVFPIGCYYIRGRRHQTV